MEIFNKLYNEVADEIGHKELFRYVCLAGSVTAFGIGIGLFGIFMISKPQQPIIVINEVKKIEKK